MNSPPSHDDVGGLNFDVERVSGGVIDICHTQVLDYDYAPASELIENRRIYLNISQEGKSDVEFLREEELLNGLQIATKGADSASVSFHFST